MAALKSQNKSITTTDLLALDIEHQRELLGPQMSQTIQIANNVDMTVNVIDSVTNQTVQTVPAKYVEYTYTDSFGTGSYKKFALLVLSNNSNTGYLVHPYIAEGLESDREAPLFVRQVLDSFELVMPTTSTAVTTSSPASAQAEPTLPPQQEQRQPSSSPPTQQIQSSQHQEDQQQQVPSQQNQAGSVSIVSSASSLTNTAYSPNPIQVSTGATVTWTNNDSQPHTVTSGSNGQPDNKFNSSPNFNPL